MGEARGLEREAPASQARPTPLRNAGAARQTCLLRDLGTCFTDERAPRSSGGQISRASELYLVRASPPCERAARRQPRDALPSAHALVMQSSLHLRPGAAQRQPVSARVAKSQARTASSDTPAERRAPAPRQPEASEGGTQKVYIGQGRYVDDDPKKYPDKNKLGVGGWAGGEAGAHPGSHVRAPVRSLTQHATAPVVGPAASARATQGCRVSPAGELAGFPERHERKVPCAHPNSGRLVLAACTATRHARVQARVSDAAVGRGTQRLDRRSVPPHTDLPPFRVPVTNPAEHHAQHAPHNSASCTHSLARHLPNTPVQSPRASPPTQLASTAIRRRTPSAPASSTPGTPSLLRCRPVALPR